MGCKVHKILKGVLISDKTWLVTFCSKVRTVVYQAGLAIVGILFLAGGVTLSCYAESNSNEYQVKASFLFNLTRMVEWPDEPVSSPIVICFYGEDFFRDALESIKDKIVRNRTLVFQKDIALSNVKQCHVLFVSRSESPNLANILLSVDRLPILTIGDVEKFAHQGGIINLLTQNNKITIEVNLRTAKNATLKISSRLLSLAHIVEK